MKKNIQKNAVLKFTFLLLLCIFSTVVHAQSKTVTGTVLDDQQIPLVGASVLIQGTSLSTTTDIDGNYSIQVAPGQTLVFSYVSMESVSVLVKDQTTINATLNGTKMLDEVIVVGYGTKKKSDVISSVVSVSAKDLTKVATSDIGEMLRGKAAGVQVTLASGAPGGSSTIRIRGQRSINGGNDPIVIADGVRIGSINDINANDIESLDVLKE